MKRKKDYYLILGVSRTESTGGIRDAFRRLAKKYHPDRAGQECTRYFQKLTEAYGVLSDPDARRSYTENLDREEERQRRFGTSFREERSFGDRFDPDDYDLFEELLQMLFRNRSDFGRRRNSRRSPTEVEVVLSRSEAERGTAVPLKVPVILRCPFCAGDGHIGFFSCPHCGGQGFAEIFEEIDLPIPPGVENGTLYEIPIGRIAGTVFSMRVRITVRSDEA